ncbi:MAG: hypothetical protein ACR5LC_00500 [Symbiopectobacterium sp.]|uniref:hypothetical protein n=1 Tax=Symbiopectobacterium sp. TaxID=2952789 RepID=UPI003F3F2BD6
MLFTLKKVVGGLLQPLPLLLVLMGVGLTLLWFSRWQRGGKAVISCAWLALLLLSVQPIADKLLLPLESHYATWQASAAPVPYIVVLAAAIPTIRRGHRAPI